MTAERFEAMVRRLEDYSRRHPVAYRVRVALLAGLGYLYIWGVVGIALTLASLIIYLLITTHHLSLLKLLVLLAVFLATILRAVRIPFSPPDGIELTPQRAPRLFRVIGSLRRFLRTAPIHHVFLTPEFNASVYQMPRLGILGWYQNYLLVGLPLMQALSPEEFRAVLAHELGHLAGQHSRFDAWIYRVERTWYQILQSMEEERHRGAWIFRVFFNVYVPYFSAYTFALRRQWEYEADRIGVQLTSPRDMVSAMIRIEIQQQRMANLWDDIAKLARQHPQSSVAFPFSESASRLLENAGSGQAALRLKQTLAEQTAVDDSHPSLRDRLMAIGVPPAGQDEEQYVKALLAYNAPLTETAASFFLGQAHRELALMLDKMWQETVQPEWSEQFQYAQRGRRRIEDLESKAQFSPLSTEELWELAQLKADLQDAEQAIPLLRQLLARAPAHLEANYLLGQLLLERKEAEGLDYLRPVMQANDELALSACYIAYQFAKEQGLEEQAKQYAEKAVQCFMEVRSAQEERSDITLHDQFEPHGLNSEQVKQLQAQLIRLSDVQMAYLVRKRVKYLPERPLYVLGVVPRVAWYEFYSRKRSQHLLTQLTTEVALPGETLVVVLVEGSKRFRKVFRRVQDALIFDRVQFRAM